MKYIRTPAFEKNPDVDKYPVIRQCNQALPYNRSFFMYKKKILLFAFFIAAALVSGGCGSTASAITRSASGKNLDLSGYLVMGKLETSNPETASPQGEFFFGKVDYKSRRVAIGADEKVPTAGNFRASRIDTIFGTSEITIEYDFTASGPAEADTALQTFNQQYQSSQALLMKD